jgi:hypothetical protein
MEHMDRQTGPLLAAAPGLGIPQWHPEADGNWISEKNPGYPFLALPFYELGIIRLAPLCYGLLACLGLFFGARRWLGRRFAGAAAVALYCSSGAAALFAWRDYMPTFTDASLIAAGSGAIVWAVLAAEAGPRHRTAVGLLGFLALEAAAFTRYTDILVLAVDRRDLAVGAALALSWLSIWGLYLAYTWTAGAVGQAIPAAGVQGIRFYVPALGAMALLGAWVLVRLPRSGPPAAHAGTVGEDLGFGGEVAGFYHRYRRGHPRRAGTTRRRGWARAEGSASTRRRFRSISMIRRSAST